MPAYSYKKRFIPKLMTGIKRGTIRKRRLKGFAVPGSNITNYYAMRTKQCERIMGPIPCTAVNSVIITKDHFDDLPFETLTVWYFDRRLTDGEVAMAKVVIEKEQKVIALLDGKAMIGDKLEAFAIADGFESGRDPEDEKTYHFSATDAFLHFWTSTHEFPFIGDHIQW
jgi:hypothetical protein